MGLPRLLIVNAGSSTLKITLLDGDDSVLESWDAMPEQLPPSDLVAHRIVHGGVTFHDAVVIDQRVEQQIRDLTELAPLHQPKALAALDQVRERLPDARHVACFDTAFHAGIPATAATYALPQDLNAKYGLRRFGFHGLSHAWASKRALAMVPAARRIVTCHLGGGASLAAVKDGHSVDTTMGFTPLAGLVMATRCGDLDPGLLLWLSSREPDLAATLETRSGLLGLAGTGDMRELLAIAETDPTAQLAIDIYVHRLRQGIAAMAASMNGIDACVFTGGVGQNSAEIRRRTVAGLGFLGLVIDDEANDSVSMDADVSADDAAVQTLVIASREDLEIASQARRLASA